MNFKVGNKVVVKNNLVIGRKYGASLFTSEMKDFSGKVVTINSVDDIQKTYMVKESSFAFTDAMIWRKATEFEAREKEESKAKVVKINSDCYASSFSAYNDLMSMMYGVQTRDNTGKEIKPEPLKVLKPYEIKAKLDEYVIGQEDAKIALSVAAYTHYMRLNQLTDDGVEIQKGNILMVGKSGSGKTLIAETLAKILDVPFIAVDITEFAPTGIVGKHMEDIIKELKNKAGGDSVKASKGIVFIDEIDKISSSASATEGQRRGILSSEVQATLLKMLEGKDVTTQESSMSMFSMYGSSTKTFSTKHILFICAGAFSGIEKILENETCSYHNPIGFGNYAVQSEMVKRTKIEASDVIQYGLMPELVGRLPVIVNLHPLEKSDLVSILTQPKNALIKQYQKMFDIADGVSLEFTEDALNKIAEISIKNQTGARGFRTIIESIVNKILFKVTQNESVWKCIINADTIDGKAEPQLLYSDTEALTQC